MTERIYYKDPYLQVFSARIVSCRRAEAGFLVELDRTGFYPTSGGQRSDRGWLGDLSVVEVSDEADRILHRVEGNPPEPGSEVEGRIDWALRFDHMQQHTAQHILSKAFVETCRANTESFHMSSGSSTIDLDVATLDPSSLDAAEDLANRIVSENRDVHIRFADAADQSSLGLRKPSERSGLLRIIEIDGFDLSACGGTHCRSTGEVGQIHLVGTERMRKKLRVEFVAGQRALNNLRRLRALVSSLSAGFSVAEDSLPDTVARLAENEKALKREKSRLIERLLEYETADVIAGCIRTGETEVVTRIWDDLDLKQLNLAAALILASSADRVALLGSRGSGGCLVFAKSPGSTVDLRLLLAQALQISGGKGGGPADRVQAGGCNPALLDAALAAARQHLIAG